MRIVHFLLGRCNPDSANGVDKAVYYLSKAQSKLGYQVLVLSMTPKSPITIDTVNIKTLPMHRNPFSLSNELLKAFDEICPDVVHLHSVFIPQNISLAKWLHSKKIPYVVTPHGGLVPQALKRKKWFKTAYKAFFEHAYWDNATFVHAIGELEAEYLKRYGIRCPIVIAPHAIEPSEIPDPASLNKNYLKEIYPYTQGKRIFLYLGRLDTEHKGLDLLLIAFAQAKNDLKDVVLILVGPDWHGQEAFLKQLARKLGISDQIVFAGPKYGREKFKIIASADVFVHISRYEAAIPFAVLEALATGRPCLVTKSVGFQDFFQKYEVGLQVKLNLDNIAEGLKYFAAISGTQLEKMASEAQKAVCQEFSWEKTARLLCRAYR